LPRKSNHRCRGGCRRIEKRGIFDPSREREFAVGSGFSASFGEVKLRR
jgi:hypothetical protein